MKIQSLNAVVSRAGKIASCLVLGVAMVSQDARSAPSYAAAVLADNPVAFWPLAETNNPSTGTLTASDSSGNGYDGTYGTTSANGFYGILAPQPPTYPGFTNGQGALGCSAGDPNSPVTIPPLHLNTNSVTIAMWINPSGGQATYTGLLMNRNASGDAAGFGFGGNQDSLGMPELGYTWNTNSGSTWGFHSGLYPVIGIWQFAALVIQSNSATIYLDYIDPNTGQTNLLSAVNSIAHDPEGFNTGGFFLGSDVNQNSVSQANNEFSGYIAGAAVYNSALTADQILALFGAGLGAQGFGPQISSQPRSQYVLSGSTARMAATGINGNSPLVYQWQLNGTNVDLLMDSANFTGANSNILTILSATTNDEGSYQLIVTNNYGLTLSSNATLTIQSPSLVGEWFDGSDASTNFADVSGYPLATNHNAMLAGIGLYEFTNDVPQGKTGQSLFLFNGDTGIAISNSSTLDASYDNTFDNRLNNAMTVACWAKGWPGGWNPFVSKYGENGLGWQLRQDGQNNQSPCWTIRGAGGAVTLGTAVYGNPEDMAATSLNLASDTNNWHLYVGTYDAATGERNLYVDGVLAASATSNVVYALAPDSHLCIGARDDGTAIGNFFAGKIYDVRVYNYAISLSQVLDLYGVVAPAISQQPTSVATFAGSTAQFSAYASGTPPLEYQWQLNGTNIDLLANNTNFTGINSNVLTVLSVSTNDVGSYHLTVTSTLGYGTVTTRDADLVIIKPSLVGEWFNGSSGLADVSGYRPAGTHDGYAVGGGLYVFTNDVPPGSTGQSLWLYNGDTGIAIQNSSTLDASYTNTFDQIINNTMTVAFWAKGAPGAWTWNPWVSKYGEGSTGWQFRTGGSGGPTPCWTVRDGGAGAYVLGGGPDWAKNGDLDDLHAATSGAGSSAVNYSVDNNWHFYAGTFNASAGLRNLYIDGVLRGQETGNVIYGLAPGAHVMIGAREDPGAGTIGNFSTFEIFDVRIYNYDLTRDEIVALMPDPIIGIQPPQSLNAYVGRTAQIRVSGIGVTSPFTNQWQLNGTNLVDGTFGGAIFSGATSVSSADSSVLTIANVTPDVQGVYRLIVSNSKGTVISSNATLAVLSVAAPPAGNLVGAWLTGAADLADTSGYQPAGTHDGFGVTGAGIPATNYAFSGDVPLGGTGQSLALSGNTAIAIHGSSLYDSSYTNTFDDIISNVTVMCWAKGVPGGWNPWVSKDGENGVGWQLRVNNNSVPTWTLRGTGGNEDMSASRATDGNWHFYAGTFDGATGIRNLYVDGVLSATESGQLPYVMDTYSFLTIGGRDTGGNSFGNYFVGNLYDVRIYDTALTEAQINWFMPTNVPLQVPEFSGPPALYGNKLVLSWDSGTLLEATNVTGPWTSTGATSPYTNDITTAPQMFYRLRNP